MTPPAYVYRIKDATGKTVMRVGGATRAKAKRLADSWQQALNRQAPGHTVHIVLRGRAR